MPKTKRALFSLHLLLSLAACLPQARLHAADADNDGLDDDWESANGLNPAKTTVLIYIDARSEERRVGKECSEPCRSRWSPYH